MSPIRWSVLLILLAGCDAGPSSSKTAPAPTSRVQVLATTYPLAEMAQRVGGQWVEIQWLIESGQRPEDIDPTPQLRQRANKAALVITSGPWDAWASAEISPESRAARLVEPDRMQSARGEEPKAYLWLTPPVQRDMIEAVRLKLTLIDPAHEQEFRKNAEVCRAEVEALEAEANKELAGGVGRKILATRKVWSTLCKRYGLALTTPVDQSEEQLTPGDLKEIAAAGKSAKATRIFVDAATPLAVRQQIEDKTNLRCEPLDAVGTSAPNGRNTWAKVFRFDVEQLQKAWQ